MQKIKKGDVVEVIAGRDIGVRGEVLRVLPKKNRLVVQGVNIVRKHQQAQQAGRSQVQPGIIEFEAPIHRSNVMLVCPHTDQPTRVGIRINEDGTKVRYSKQSGQDID